MDKGTFAGRVKRLVSGWLDAAASKIVDFANSPALVEASARHAQTTAAGPARFRAILPWALAGALLVAIAAFFSPSPALVTGAWVGGLTVAAGALAALRRKLADAQGAANAEPLLALLGASLIGAAWPFALARLGEPSGPSAAYLLGAAGAVLLAAALGRSAWGCTPDDIRRQLGRLGQRSAWLLLALFGASALAARLLPGAAATWLEAALLCGAVLAGLWLAAEVAWTAGKRILGHAVGPSALRDDLGFWLRGAHARVTARAGQPGTGGSAAATAASSAALTTLTMVALALGIALLNKGTDLVRLGGLAAPFAEELHVSVDTILLWSISGLLAGTLGTLYWVVVRRGAAPRVGVSVTLLLAAAAGFGTMSLVAWLPAVPGVILLVLAQCAVGASLPVMGVLVGAALAGRSDQARQQLRLEILGSPLAHAVTLGAATLVQFVSIQVAVLLLAALCVVQAVLLKVAPGIPQKARVPPAKALRVLARRPGTAAAWIGGVLAFGPIAYAYTLAVLRADELHMPPLALVATISCLGFLASFTAWRLLRARVVADARGVAILGAGIMVVAVLLAVIPSSGLAGGLLAFAAIFGLEFGVFGVNSLFQTWLGDKVRGETQTDRVQKRLVYVTTRSLAMFVFAGLEVFPIDAVRTIAPFFVVVAVLVVPFLISLRRVERHDDVQLETGDLAGRVRVSFHLATSAHQTVVAVTLGGQTRAYSVMPGDLIRAYLVREQVVDQLITLRVYARLLPGGRGASMFPGADIADGRLTVLPPGLRAVHDTLLERDAIDPDVLRALEAEHFYGTGQVRRLDVHVELVEPARVRVAPLRVKHAGDEEVAQLRLALSALRGRFGDDVEVSAGRGVDGLDVYIGCDLSPEELDRLAADLPELGYQVTVRDVNDVAVIAAQ